MAQYEITHTCGHTETLRLFGPGKERDKEIARESERLCGACYIAAQRLGGNEPPKRVLIRTTSQGIEVAVIGGFEIKDDLKQLGFRFSDSIVLPESPLGFERQPTGFRDTSRKGWLYVCRDTAEVYEAVRWLKDSGFTPEELSPIELALSAPGEGRPDFLGRL